MIIAIVFSKAAGKTTALTSAKNGPGNPEIISADPKKITPEISVPIAVNTAILTIEKYIFFTIKNNP